MNSNFEEIPPDTKYKFLCYKKVEVMFLNTKLLKSILEAILNYLKNYKDKVLLILKMQIIIVLFGHILDI